MTNVLGQWRPIDESAQVVIGDRYRMDLTITSRRYGAELDAGINMAVRDTFTELSAQAPNALFDVVEVSTPRRIPELSPQTYSVRVVFDVHDRYPGAGGGTGSVAVIWSPVALVKITLGKILWLIAGALLAQLVIVISRSIWKLDPAPPLRTALWLLALGGVFILLYPGIMGAIRRGRRMLPDTT